MGHAENAVAVFGAYTQARNTVCGYRVTKVQVLSTLCQASRANHVDCNGKKPTVLPNAIVAMMMRVSPVIQLPCTRARCSYSSPAWNASQLIPLSERSSQTVSQSFLRLQ